MKTFILALFVALIFPAMVHAQTGTKVPGDSKATIDSASEAQAPDEVTNKISDLVHAGKYAEAQQLTTGLLQAYPNDQRLIKAKALLEKLAASDGSADANPGSSQPANNRPQAETLRGMDKVDYNALIELARQAQQSTDLEQQKTLLQRFMDQSNVLLQKHPEQMLLWQLRAASAISLNEPMAGYDAGQKLLALGAADSNDVGVQRLLADLRNKGWLDKQQLDATLAHAETARIKAEHDKYTFPVERSRGAFRWSEDGFGHLTIDENALIYEGSDGRVEFSKDAIREFRFWGERGGNLIAINPKDGKGFDLWLTTEEVVTHKRKHGKDLPSTALGQAVAERWKFVWDHKHKTLTPPGSNSAASDAEEGRNQTH